MKLKNMESLVKEILSVSKLELKMIDDMKPISVTDILKHTCERLYPLAEEKKITIHQADSRTNSNYGKLHSF